MRKRNIVSLPRKINRNFLNRYVYGNAIVQLWYRLHRSNSLIVSMSNCCSFSIQWEQQGLKPKLPEHVACMLHESAPTVSYSCTFVSRVTPCMSSWIYRLNAWATKAHDTYMRTFFFAQFNGSADKIGLDLHFCPSRGWLKPNPLRARVQFPIWSFIFRCKADFVHNIDHISPRYRNDDLVSRPPPFRLVQAIQSAWVLIVKTWKNSIPVCCNSSNWFRSIWDRCRLCDVVDTFELMNYKILPDILSGVLSQDLCLFFMMWRLYTLCTLFLGWRIQGWWDAIACFLYEELRPKPKWVWGSHRIEFSIFLCCWLNHAAAIQISNV